MGDDEQPTQALLSSAHLQLTHDSVECSICTLPVDQAQPLFYSWAAREGWNPASIDPLLWAAIDNRAFHVLYRLPPATTASNHPAAATTAEPICILATLIIDDDHAFLGPFITAAAYQRRGFGSLLFDWGMKRLDPSRRCIGLDSTLEQQSSYQRRGFKHTVAEEWRYAGIVSRPDGGEPMEAAGEVEVVAVTNSDRVQLEQLYALYEQCSESGLSTPSFCHTLLTSPQTIAFAALSLTTPPQLSGLVVARRAGRGWRVAPLLAQSPQVAVAAVAAAAVGAGQR